MVPYEKLNNLYEVLIEAIDVEESKKHKSEREKLMSKGIADASRFGVRLIERSKEIKTRENVISSLNSRVNASIYSLLRCEYKYEIRKSNEYKRKIIYYGSFVETIQIIRDKVKKII